MLDWEWMVWVLISGLCISSHWLAGQPRKNIFFSLLVEASLQNLGNLIRSLLRFLSWHGSVSIYWTGPLLSIMENSEIALDLIFALGYLQTNHDSIFVIEMSQARSYRLFHMLSGSYMFLAFSLGCQNKRALTRGHHLAIWLVNLRTSEKHISVSF